MAVMLTTVDNPHNPFTHWDEWYVFDRDHGYHTPEYLARITNTSDELSEFDQELAIDVAIKEILEFNVLGIYTTVSEPD